MPQYVEPQELAGVRGIPDSEDDTWLEAVINSAEEKLDEWCGWGVGGFNQDTSATPRVFSTRHVSADGCLLTMPAGFVSVTGLVIETDDNDDGTFETTWAASDYELLPVGNYFGGVDGFPFFQINAVGTKTFPTSTTRQGVIRVTATWGWGSVPEAVRTAVKLRASALRERDTSLSGRDPITGFRAGGFDKDWPVELGKLRHPRKIVPFA